MKKENIMKKGKIFLTALFIGFLSEGSLHAKNIEIYYSGPGLSPVEFNKSSETAFFTITDSRKYAAIISNNVRNPVHNEVKAKAYILGRTEREIGPINFGIGETRPSFTKGVNPLEKVECTFNGSPYGTKKLPILRNYDAIKGTHEVLQRLNIKINSIHSCSVEPVYGTETIKK
jgi:hypothetical protein